MAIETVCDECETIFEMKLEEVKTENGNIKTTFTCPGCQHEYLAFVTNESIKEKQKDIRELRKQAQDARGKSKRARRLFEKIKRKRAKLDKEMAELKNEPNKKD